MTALAAVLWIVQIVNAASTGSTASACGRAPSVGLRGRAHRAVPARRLGPPAVQHRCPLILIGWVVLLAGLRDLARSSPRVVVLGGGLLTWLVGAVATPSSSARAGWSSAGWATCSPGRVLPPDPVDRRRRAGARLLRHAAVRAAPVAALARVLAGARVRLRRRGRAPARCCTTRGAATARCAPPVGRIVTACTRADRPGRDAPIGMIDSGVGGLTVARAVLDQLPHEALHYVGDTAHGPYGPQPIARRPARTRWPSWTSWWPPASRRWSSPATAPAPPACATPASATTSRWSRSSCRRCGGRSPPPATAASASSAPSATITSGAYQDAFGAAPRRRGASPPPARGSPSSSSAA